MKCKIVKGDLIFFRGMEYDRDSSINMIIGYYSRVINKYTIRHKNITEDLIQECNIAIIKKYDSEDFKFLTVKFKVFKMLSGIVKNYIRKSKLSSNMIGSRNKVRRYSILNGKYKDRSITNEEVKELHSLHKHIVNIDSKVDIKDILKIEYVDKDISYFTHIDILNKISDNEERFILNKFYIEDLTDSQIAIILNKSKPSIKKKRQRALDKLRDSITTKEFIL